MAVTSFKHHVWEQALIVPYHNRSVAELLSARPTKLEGTKAVFNVLAGNTINDYSGTVSFEDIRTTSVDLNFDQKKYWAVKLDDVDSAQLVNEGALMGDLMTEQAYLMAETIDTKFLTEACSTPGTEIGSASAKKTITKADIYDYIVDLGTALNKKKVPRSNRFVVVPSDILGLLSKDARFTLQPVILSNGVVEGQTINGMQVVVSEELPAGKIVALHKDAVGYGKQLDQTEAMRLETSFADGVRGLAMYGVATLRKDAKAVLHYTIGA